MDQTLVITLDPPVTTPDGGTVSELSLRVPTIAEAWAADKKLTGAPGAGRDFQIEFICQVTKLSRPTVLQLPAPVVNQAARFLEQHGNAGLGSSTA